MFRTFVNPTNSECTTASAASNFSELLVGQCISFDEQTSHSVTCTESKLFSHSMPNSVPNDMFVFQTIVC